MNFSYWWSNQSGHDANPRILPFASLAPGASQTVTTSITAPSTNGTYTLNFDLVKEGSCWFSDNVSGCSGPGNSINSTSITVTSPTVSAGSGLAAICQGATTAALGGSYGGSATSAVWSDGGAGGTFTNNGGTTPNTTTYTASATAPTSITLTLTTSGGSCGTTSASKTLTVNPKPTVNAGGAITAICQGGTTSALGGSFGGGATAAVWSDGGAGGTFTNNTGTTPGTTTYGASATAPATVTLTLTTSGGSCGATSASKTLTINANPIVNAGSAVTAICQGGTTSALGGSFGGGATAAVWSDGGAGGTFTNNTGTTPGTTTYSASATAPATVTLTLTTSGGSCGITSASKTLTINANPTVNAGSAVTAICQGGTTSALGGSFGGGATAAVWTDGGAGGIFTNNTGSTPGTTTYTASATAPATVTLTLTTSGGSCGTVFATKTLTVNPSPIVSAGGAIAAICQGGTTSALGGSFSGGATSAIWDDGGAGGTFTNNGGSTPGTATYTAFATAPVSVTLTLTTSGGSCGTVTDSKTLTVYQQPIITTQPSPVNDTICAASNISYSVVATGTGLTYQWYRGTTALINAGRITGATSATLAITGTTLADNGIYTVVVSGSSPCASVTSVNDTLVVNQSITFTSQPVTPQTICQGQSYIISASTSGTVATWEWYYNGNPYSAGSFDGSNTYTLTIPAVAVSDAGSYRLLLDDGFGGGCHSANSNIAVLNVNPTSVGGSVTSDATVCYGTNSGTLTLSGQTGNVVRWESSTDGGTTWTPISNTTTSQTYTNLTQTTLYRAVVQSGVCPSDNSTPATITVNANLVAGTVGSDQTICYNTAPAAFTNIASPTGGTGTYTYQWQSASALAGPYANITGATSTTYTPGALTATTYFRRNETSGTCGTVSSNVITITVDANLVAGTVGSNQTICYNTSPAAFTSTALPTAEQVHILTNGSQHLHLQVHMQILRAQQLLLIPQEF